VGRSSMAVVSGYTFLLFTLVIVLRFGSVCTFERSFDPSQPGIT
jgi:hypothetical protein